MGHVTVDLVSFPDPTSPNAHPLFWAIDLNCQMTDYAAACSFFDFLMVSPLIFQLRCFLSLTSFFFLSQEGQIDQLTGKYTINNQVRNSEYEGASTNDASSQGGPKANDEELNNFEDRGSSHKSSRSQTSSPNKSSMIKNQ